MKSGIRLTLWNSTRIRGSGECTFALWVLSWHKKYKRSGVWGNAHLHLCVTTNKICWECSKPFATQQSWWVPDNEEFVGVGMVNDSVCVGYFYSQHLGEWTLIDFLKGQLFDVVWIGQFFGICSIHFMHSQVTNGHNGALMLPLM